jgi:hypothetical protein
MSTAVKDRIDKWLPSIIAVLIQLAAVSYWGGTITARLGNVEAHSNSTTIHMPLREKVDMFVTRPEFAAEKAARTDDRITMRTIEQKLDRLIERGSKGIE